VAKNLQIGETVFVPRARLDLDENKPSAFLKTEVMEVVNRSVRVKLEDGLWSDPVATSAVHRDIGVLIFRIGDFSTETSLLDPLRQSVDTLIELADGESGLPRHRDSAAWALFYLSKQLTAEDSDAARSAIESAIEQREKLPERANWLESFAWLLLHSPVDDLKDAERAESLVTLALKLAPENPRFLRTLALAQLRLEKVDEAAGSLSQVSLQTGSSHPEQELLSAIVAFRKNREAEAKSLTTKAVETIRAVAPANPRLLQIQQEAEAITGIIIPVSEDGETAEALPAN
jgi:hypothetical protein